MKLLYILFSGTRSEAKLSLTRFRSLYVLALSSHYFSNACLRYSDSFEAAARSDSHIAIAHYGVSGPLGSRNRCSPRRIVDGYRNMFHLAEGSTEKYRSLDGAVHMAVDSTVADMLAGDTEQSGTVAACLSVGDVGVRMMLGSIWCLSIGRRKTAGTDAQLALRNMSVGEFCILSLSLVGNLALSDDECRDGTRLSHSIPHIVGLARDDDAVSFCCGVHHHGSRHSHRHSNRVAFCRSSPVHGLEICICRQTGTRFQAQAPQAKVRRSRLSHVGSLCALHDLPPTVGSGSLDAHVSWFLT